MSSDFIPFHIPDIGEEEIRSVVATLRSGWLTTGLKAKEFEERFAAYIGCPHAVAVNSGTAALHLALEAAGVQAGDEVIVPTMTFTATAEVVTYLGARPVLVDCQADTLNIDSDAIIKAIGPKTRAVMPVDFGGQPCELEKIGQIARERKLAVIEDAAHALPARYKGQMIGTLGDVTCFSFYATKTMTTGEGGMATTANPEWAKRMRMMSLHGISKDAWKRYTASGSWYYEVESPGYKYNLTDIAAALGIVQLGRAEEFHLARRRIAGLYDRGFVDLPEVHRLAVRPDVQHAWHLYVIQLELERLRIGRDEFIDVLKKKNIGTSVHFIPLHLHPYYRRVWGYTASDCPTATAAFARTISLPIFPGMGDDRVERVIEGVRNVVGEYRR
jgi:dTDP-4-amino-4,6-dideoxygalactose transaminase